MSAFDPLRTLAVPGHNEQMKTLLLLGFAVLLLPANAVAAAPAQPTQTLAPSAQIDEPPGPSKLLLIRRFLRAIGRQYQLDTGSFLERYALRRTYVAGL
jgi:hypothetical protein